MSSSAPSGRIDPSNLEVFRRGLVAFAEQGYDNTEVRERARSVGVEMFTG